MFLRLRLRYSYVMLSCNEPGGSLRNVVLLFKSISLRLLDVRGYDYLLPPYSTSISCHLQIV